MVPERLNVVIIDVQLGSCKLPRNVFVRVVNLEKFDDFIRFSTILIEILKFLVATKFSRV